MINDVKYQNITDFGANKVLGMGGSLTGYIQTGNAYDKRYYHSSVNDKFISNKKKNIKNKILTAAAGILTACSVAFVAYKTGLYKKIDLNGLCSKAKSALSNIHIKNPVSSASTEGSCAGDKFLKSCFDYASK